MWWGQEGLRNSGLWSIQSLAGDLLQWPQPWESEDVDSYSDSVTDWLGVSYLVQSQDSQ